MLPPHYLSWISILLTLLMQRFSLPSPLYLCTYRCHSLLPLWSAHASCRLDPWLATSTLVAWLVAITLVLRLTGLNPSGSFSCTFYRTVLSALINPNFFLSILSWPILIYSPRSYEAGAFLSFGPTWTAYGLGQ